MTTIVARGDRTEIEHRIKSRISFRNVVAKVFDQRARGRERESLRRFAIAFAKKEEGSNDKERK